ncbi:MAG: PEP-CTERM sorting domain-containing protein [Phycisphaerales bacterium]|nr:PEP-CTERM sorting domain-containing protein [Phycisphaerales bacterium]
MVTLQPSVRAALCAACLFAIPAFADFGGQPILGPLTNFSFVSGTTSGKPDNNDGFTSGDHIFNIWDGGDVVYQLNWTGGDMFITLESLGGSDNDLFLYTPDSYNDSGIYSIAGSHDEVSLMGAAAGTYYIVVDSTFTSEGAYNLAVIPAPSAGLAMLAGIGLCGARRRRG